MLVVSLAMAMASGLFGQAGALEAGRSANAATMAAPKPAYVPPTERERLRMYFKELVSPEAVVRSAAGAGIGQWRDVPHEWGEGGLGFGRRFASSYAEHIVRETLLFGSSSALHEDNRYIRSSESGVGNRLKYALESSVLARHDDGTRHLTFAKIGSFLGAAFISRTWQPASTRGPAHAGYDFGISMGASAGFNVVREFLPDLFHRKQGSEAF